MQQMTSLSSLPPSSAALDIAMPTIPSPTPSQVPDSLHMSSSADTTTELVLPQQA